MRKGYPTPRLEAKAKGLLTYFSGKPCIHGHVTERYVKHGNCLGCLAEKREYFNNYAKTHKETMRSAGRRFRKNHPDVHCAIQALRRADKLQRTPSWANLEAIQTIYSQAKEITEKTGIEHHVDHILPLKGELVSGLHVAENLQILLGMDNVLKSNRFII